ncbi:DUF4198 domain-containing protein [Brevundimonas vesicularis]|uniref:DUF4198 domain-containing protein n=1 Tax=Brevundimonas vesicularis TaxID=41276 RepID=UPI000AB58967|nr:DUF4198 domain-containing protein [Brevundimonas vesicularis]
MKKRLLLAVTAGLGLFASAAAAHDFFLVPDRFAGPRTQPLIVHATSSSDFPALNVSSPQSRVGAVRASVGGHPASVTIQDRAAQSLRLAVSSERPGMAVVTLQTIWGESSWRPDQVDTYLEEHPFKVEEVAAVRRLLPEGSTLNIQSRRLAKTLACFETCDPTGTGPTGLEVEFLPEFDAGHASPTRFQLVRNGQPLTSHPVTVRFGHGQRHEAMTDQEGRLSLPEGVTGPVMLVAATLNVPSQAGGRFVTNNASLTFNATADHTGH